MKYENQPPGPTCALEKAQIVQLGSYINKYIYILYFILGPRPRNLNLYYKINFFFGFAAKIKINVSALNVQQYSSS